MSGRTRKLALTVVVLAWLVGVLSVGVLGVFTDSEAVAGNTFATSNVDISTSPASALATFSGMVPGDQVTAPITVTNAGGADLRYAITSTTTENALAASLDLTVKSGVTTCTNAGFGASGSVLYGPNDLGTTAGANVVGNPAQGADAGDRALTAGANETLCVNVSLPLSTGNASQSLTTTTTFAFQAEQTRNNP